MNRTTLRALAAGNVAAIILVCALSACGSGSTASPPARSTHSVHGSHHEDLPLNPPDVSEPTPRPVSGSPTYRLQVNSGASMSVGSVSGPLATSSSPVALSFSNVQAGNQAPGLDQLATTGTSATMTVVATSSGSSHSYVLNHALIKSATTSTNQSSPSTLDLSVVAASIQQTS